MASYYFHFFNGMDVLRDREGRSLPGLTAVVDAALAEARSLISLDVLTGYIALGYRLDVEEEGHVLVHRLSFDDAVTVLRSGDPLPAIIR